MAKKWSAIIGILMAFLVLATAAVPAFAQPDGSVKVVERVAESNATTSGPVTQVAKPAEPIASVPRELGIRAPQIAPVGQEVTITVYERASGNPVARAGVWAVSWEEGNTLRGEIDSIAEGSNYTALCNTYGEFLGWTGTDGQVKHTFQETGKYLLVAVKDGYYPGFASLTVRDVPRALGIRAPRVARVYEPVTMTVFERWTHERVEGAGVWAFRENSIDVLKDKMTELRKADEVAAQSYDYEPLIGAHGEFLGRTNQDGQLTHAFDRAGNYYLVTWKSGYLPAFAPITIKGLNKTLILRVPDVATVGQVVTMTVYEGPGPISAAVPRISEDTAGVTAVSPDSSGAVVATPATTMNVRTRMPTLIAMPAFEAEGTGNTLPVAEDIQPALPPVEGAGIWAFSRDEVGSVEADLSAMSDDETAADSRIESYLKAHGQFLGYTDDHGQLRYAFTEAGSYLLVAWKKGYRPGFDRIVIKPEIKSVVIHAPRMAWQGEDVTMTVSEKSMLTVVIPVKDASVWAVPRIHIEKLEAEIEANGTAADSFDWEALVRPYGEFLGYTDENGQLTHAFNRPGDYTLIACKRGYHPGRTPITIMAKPMALAIKAPKQAFVRQDVTMTVYDRWSHDVVGGAHMWAFSWDYIDSLDDTLNELRTMDESGMELQAVMPDLGGEYLGQTNRSGRLTHAFDAVGRYLLITFKDGYWPGFSTIRIIWPEIVEVPDSAGSVQ